MDEMGREGKSTYVLGPDGKFSNLKEFIDELIGVSKKADVALNKLNAKIRKEEDVDSKLLLEELYEEFKKLPIKVEEWKKLNDYALVAGEVINTIIKVARRLKVFGKKVGDKELEELASDLFKLVRRIYPWVI
jgi:ABC-type uncharacterized transport system ATPase subunit